MTKISQLLEMRREKFKKRKEEKGAYVPK